MKKLMSILILMVVSVVYSSPYDINTDLRIVCPYNPSTNQYQCMQPEQFPSIFRIADEGIYHVSPLGNDFFEILDFQTRTDGSLILVRNKIGQTMSFYFTPDWIIGQNGIGYGSAVVKLRVAH